MDVNLVIENVYVASDTSPLCQILKQSDNYGDLGVECRLDVLYDISTRRLAALGIGNVMPLLMSSRTDTHGYKHTHRQTSSMSVVLSEV